MSEKSSIFAAKLQHMISDKLDNRLVETAQRMLSEAHRVVIFSHMAPDGDAMGSSLAMGHYIKDRFAVGPLCCRTADAVGPQDKPAERQVTVIVPNAYPDFLAWLPGAADIMVYEGHAAEADRLIAEADLHICLDFNDPKRIGPAGDKLLLNPCKKILIDHHLMNIQRDEGQCTKGQCTMYDVQFSFPDASSTCELVYRLLWQMNRKPFCSKDVAVCLYTGLMTDTGNFSYNSNNAELYEMVADLVRAGVDKDAVYNLVFNQMSADRLRLTGYCLHRRMRIIPEYHLAIISVSHAELMEFRFQPGDTEGIVNMPLQISDVYYSIFLREEPAKPGTPASRIKLSFRSQGDRPVNILAAEVFRGGGHMNASGGEFFGTLNAAVQRLMKAYPLYLKKE